MTARDGVIFDHVTWGGREGGPLLRDMHVRFPRNRSTAILGTRNDSLRAIVDLVSGAKSPTSGGVQRECAVSFPINYAQGLGRYLTGIDNVFFIAQIYKKDPMAVAEFVKTFSELGDDFYGRISNYTPEQRSQFFISLSYAIPFDMYLSGGTVIAGTGAFREKCRSYIQKLRQNAGIIITTKSPQIVRMFCDDVYVLENGRLISFTNMRAGIRYFVTSQKRAALNELDTDAEEVAEIDDGEEDETERYEG